MTDVNAQVRARRRWLWPAVAAGVVVVAVAAAAVWLAVGRDDGGIGQLRARDPHGAAACRDLREWAAGRVKSADGKPENSIVISVAAGPEAWQASTNAIRATAGGPLLDQQTSALLGVGRDMRAANLTQLRAACVGAGVQVDPLPAT
jgi:hypothetical protein